MLSEKDMLDLRKIFLEEADDLFNKIEEGLLTLENSPEDKSLIDAVFRSIHTLKGSSGMIGSTRVTEFVHNLETIYDNVRAGHLLLNSDIIDCGLKSMDHIKKLISDPDSNGEQDIKNEKNLTERILKILEGIGKIDKSETQQNSIELDNKTSTYHISFQPNPDIFDDGSNPLLLIDELSELGETIAFPHIDLGSIKKFNPKKCYTSWNIILSTSENHTLISDVFIFVEDNCDIEITHLYDGNLLSIKSFTDQLPTSDLSSNVVNVDMLKSIVSGLQIEEVTTEFDTMAEGTKSDNTMKNMENSDPENEAKSIPKIDSISSIRVSSDKLDELMNHVSELVTSQAGLDLYAKNNFDPTLDAIADNIEKLARQLRDIAFDMTLIEIENLFSRFHRSVRDISSQLNKSVSFKTIGGETELDKKIIENLADPLMHLIRNSLDHGIETKEERVAKGKPEKGTIKLTAFYSGAKILIQIEDDGKGIDPEKIRKKAIKNGLIQKDTNLTEKEIFDLIFVPGFSLAANVTDLSGRGVGMDVVRKNVLDLRGNISVESVVDQGTKITIELPLTLSVIDGLQVTVGDTNYIIPLSVVDKCYELKREDLLNDFNQLVVLDEEQYPYVDLRKEFNYSDESAPEYSSIILVQSNENKMCICVDEIIGEYQAVLKPVGKFYRNQKFVSGATILGDGTIALVLDASNIITKQNINQKLMPA